MAGEAAQRLVAHQGAVQPPVQCVALEKIPAHAADNTATVGWLRAGGEARIDAAVSIELGELRRSTARSLGNELAGKGQVRGSGTLALTQDAVHFAQWATDRSLRIPRSSITRVDTARSHLGKRVGADLLRIAWSSEAGDDVVAFQVPDLGDWLLALRT